LEARTAQSLLPDSEVYIYILHPLTNNFFTDGQFNNSSFLRLQHLKPKTHA
jgi:hypothetical protein